jgi:hypothetical protein
MSETRTPRHRATAADTCSQLGASERYSERVAGAQLAAVERCGPTGAAAVDELQVAVVAVLEEGAVGVEMVGRQAGRRHAGAARQLEERHGTLARLSRRHADYGEAQPRAVRCGVVDRHGEGAADDRPVVDAGRAVVRLPVWGVRLGGPCRGRRQKQPDRPRRPGISGARRRRCR